MAEIYKAILGNEGLRFEISQNCCPLVCWESQIYLTLGPKVPWPKSTLAQKYPGPKVPSGPKVPWPKSTFWPNCPWPKSTFWPKSALTQKYLLAQMYLAQIYLLAQMYLAQIWTLAQNRWPKCTWPKCHSGPKEIQPHISRPRVGAGNTPHQVLPTESACAWVEQTYLPHRPVQS